MAEEPKPQNPVHYVWSAIAPGDLGLKVGYWSRKEEEALTFKDIVGWVTIVSRQVSSADSPPSNGLYAVVLAADMYPTLAVTVPDYCGVFLKHMSEEQAKMAFAGWAKPAAGVKPQPNINVKGTGLA